MAKSKTSPPATPILEDELGLGTPPVSAEESSLEESPPIEPELLSKSQPADRLWYKQPKIIGLISLAVIVVIGGIMGSLAWRNRTTNRDFISDQWRGIEQQSVLVATTADKAGFDATTELTRELLTLTNKLGDATDASQKQPTFLSDASQLTAFRSMLVDIKKYTDTAKGQSADLSKLKNTDLDTLKSLATAMKLSVGEGKTKLALSTDLSEGFYKLSERLDTIIAAHENTENEKQAAVDATKSKEELARQDQANSEEAVARWTTAYKYGSVADMKLWMTAAFAKEYDFSEVTASYRTTNYPTGFRRVSTDKKSDQYEIVETITYVTKSDYTADTNYTQTFVFLVSRDASSKKWLVNSRRSSY